MDDEFIFFKNLRQEKKVSTFYFALVLGQIWLDLSIYFCNHQATWTFPYEYQWDWLEGQKKLESYSLIFFSLVKAVKLST